MCLVLSQTKAMDTSTIFRFLMAAQSYAPHTLEIKKKLNETDATLLQLGIVEIRQLFF